MFTDCLGKTLRFKLQFIAQLREMQNAEFKMQN